MVKTFTILREHRHFGRQIFLLAKNELIKTYKGAVIGPLWAVVKPLFTLFVYWFAFDVGLRSAGNVAVLVNGTMEHYPRFIFMLVGFIPWFFISDCILQGSKCIRENRQFVTKVSFPVSTIMTYTNISRLYTHLLLTVLMYIYMLFAHGPSIYNLQFFYYCPLMFLFFLVLSWSTAPMCAFSLDFQNMINSVMTGLFWLSGIIYNSYDVPYEWLRKLMLLNPVNYFVNGYRNAFLYDRWFTNYPSETLIILVEFAALFALGAYNYKRLRKKLADVL